MIGGLACVIAKLPDVKQSVGQAELHSVCLSINV
jgi:hypothetical protein